MKTGNIYPKVIRQDDHGAVLDMELYRHNGANSSWKDRACGAVRLTHNDGLCDVYAVFLDGHQIGIIEDYGTRISLFPDLDDVREHEAAFRAAREGLS